MKLKHLFLVAGEKSGDLHGGALMQELKKKDKDLSFLGVGGQLMQEEGLQSLFPFTDFQVMGFSDVISSLPRLCRHFYALRDAILNSSSEGVVFIDYPGFNLRLAKALRKKGYKGKLVQYISPTVWAWGHGRIHTMQSSLDLLLTIFPFEPPYFSGTSLDVRFVGNPLVEKLQTHRFDPDWKNALHIPVQKPLLALFPGSRKGEIERNLTLQLQAAEHLKKNYPELCFALSTGDGEFEGLILQEVKKSALKQGVDLFFFPEKWNYECMRDCTMALTKSGTITLELALLGCPAVVIYRLSHLNYFLAKYIFRVNLPHYCIANILLNETLYQEKIGRSLCPLEIACAAEKCLSPDAKKHTENKSKTLRRLLTEQNASEKAAQFILEKVIC